MSSPNDSSSSSFWSRIAISCACVVFAVVAVAGCGTNECSFGERCKGNIRQTCGEGPDQFAGRDIHEQPCEAPNPKCVEVRTESRREAYCVREPVEECDKGAYEKSCIDETRRLLCVGVSGEAGYVKTEVCDTTGYDGAENPHCEEKTDGATCCFDRDGETECSRP